MQSVSYQQQSIPQSMQQPVYYPSASVQQPDSMYNQQPMQPMQPQPRKIWPIVLAVVILLAGVYYVFIHDSNTTNNSTVNSSSSSSSNVDSNTSNQPTPNVVNPSVDESINPSKAVKTIIIHKDNLKLNFTGDARSLNIGEVLVVDIEGTVLSVDDFESVVLMSEGKVVNAFASYPVRNVIDGKKNTFMHSPVGTNAPNALDLIINLKNPTLLARIEIWNRPDCCRDRLAGSVVMLKNNSGGIITTQTLNGNLSQNIIVDPVANSML